MKIFGLFLLLISNVCFAWDGYTKGKLNSTDAGSAEDKGFRISLQGLPQMCTNGTNWAYINKSHDNYQVIVSILLAANLAGKTVEIFTTNIGGFCAIGYVGLGS